jgi:hypothetical protein
MTQEDDRIRTIAGYLLKNNARLILSAPVEVAEFVKSAVLGSFANTSILIRNAASQDIVAFLGVLEPKNWPECLQHLVLALDSPDLDRQEVSFLISESIFLELVGGLRRLLFCLLHLKRCSPMTSSGCVQRVGKGL